MQRHTSHIPPEKASFSFHWGGGGGGRGRSRGRGVHQCCPGGLILCYSCSRKGASSGGHPGDGDMEMETSLRGGFS